MLFIHKCLQLVAVYSSLCVSRPCTTSLQERMCQDSLLCMHLYPQRPEDYKSETSAHIGYCILSNTGHRAGMKDVHGTINNGAFVQCLMCIGEAQTDFYVHPTTHNIFVMQP